VSVTPRRNVDIKHQKQCLLYTKKVCYIFSMIKKGVKAVKAETSSHTSSTKANVELIILCGLF
jgi:hypothetical protein